MCNRACIEYGRTHLTQEEVQGKRVIEVGALDVNGSLRVEVQRLAPQRYLGVDITRGPGVDDICDIGDLENKYGAESFDVVICTEVMEHVRDWRGAVSNLKRALRPQGVLLLTTRSKGFHYHGYPHDFWRYEVDDMKAIFSDLAIEDVCRDPSGAPGVFLKARKPASFVEKSTDAIELYSIIVHHRCKDVGALAMSRFRIEWKMWGLLSGVLPASMRTAIKSAVCRDIVM